MGCRQCGFGPLGGVIAQHRTGSGFMPQRGSTARAMRQRGQPMDREEDWCRDWVPGPAGGAELYGGHG